MATNPNASSAPATIQPGSTSQLKSVTPEEAVRLQGRRDGDYSMNTAKPQLITNPRETGTPAYVNPPTAQSGLRQMTAQEQANIDTAREEKYGQSAPESALITNPRETPASPAEAPSQESQTSTPAPTSETLPTPPVQTGMTPEEQQAVQNAMSGFVGTLGGYWETMQKMSQQLTDFNNRMGIAQPGALPTGPTTPGAAPGEESPERVTTPIGFGAELGTPPQGPQVSSDNGQIVTPQVAAEQAQENAALKSQMNNPATGSFVSPDSTADNSQGQKFLDSVLKDPTKATYIPEGLDPLSANVQQMMDAVMAGQLQQDKFTDQIIQNMERRRENMELGMKEAEDRTIRDAAMLSERIQKEAEQARSQVTYEMDKGTRSKEKSIQEMEDNNSRLWGFMQRRLAKMGATDSSAAVAQLHKYTSLAVSQLADARDDLTDYRAMMVSKEADIAYKMGQQLIDIENQKNDTILQSRRQMYDQMLQIDSQILSTSSERAQQKQAAIVQMTEMKNAAYSQAQQLTMQARAQNLQEAEFAFTQIQTEKDNQFRLKQLDEQVRQFDDTMNFDRDQQLTQETGNLYFNGKPLSDPATGEPIRAISGKAWDMQVDQFLTDATGYLYRNGKKTDTITWARQQFAQQMALSRDQFDLDVAEFRTGATGNVYDPITGQVIGRSMAGSQFDLEAETARIDLQMKKINAGIADPSSLNQFKSAYDIMTQGTYVNLQGKQQTLGDRIADGLRQAASAIKNGNSAFQCVQFVRAVLPDLPYGLTTLADKVQKLVKSPNGLPPGSIPQPGDAIILNWNAPGDNYGHIANVTHVEGNTAYFVQHNVPSGKVSQGKIDLNNKDIKGYWRSPSVKQEAVASPQLDQINKVTAGLSEGKKADYRQIMMDKIKQGDIEGFLSTAQDAAYEGMSPNLRNEYDDAGTMAQQFTDAATQAQNFMDTLGGNPGMWNMKIEELRNLANTERDPKYQATLQAVAMPALELANKLLGAAQSEPEMQRAVLAIPSGQAMTLKDIVNLSQGLAKIYYRKQGIIINNATNPRPPRNANGMIDTPAGEVSPEEYDQMMLILNSQ